MEKKNLIIGGIGAVVLVVALIGLKMYKEGNLPGPVGQETTGSAVQQSAPVDPYATYSAPTNQ